MNYSDRIDWSAVTYGAEIEAAGMRRDTILDPETEGEWCTVEGSIHDRILSIGNDPKGEYNLLGGEIKVRYGHSAREIEERIKKLLIKTQCPEINMPSTMHQHIRIPELSLDENLDILKHIVMYNQRWLPEIIDHISPLPDMDFIKSQKYESEEQRKMFIRAYKDKHSTRHSIYTDRQIDRMMKQTTFKDFINAIPDAWNSKTNTPMWGITMRTGVNFSKMRFSDGNTLEFRMFSASSDPEIIHNITHFPEAYIKCALEDIPPDFVYDLKWPDFYNWTSEPNDRTIRWLKTDHDKLERKVIICNIKEMLLSKEISLKDLGNPLDFWKRELGDKFSSVRME